MSTFLLALQTSNIDVCCFVPHSTGVQFTGFKMQWCTKNQIWQMERYSTVKTQDNSYEVVQCTYLASVDTAVDWVILIGDTDSIWIWIIFSILSTTDDTSPKRQRGSIQGQLKILLVAWIWFDLLFVVVCPSRWK